MTLIEVGIVARWKPLSKISILLPRMSKWRKMEWEEKSEKIAILNDGG